MFSVARQSAFKAARLQTRGVATKPATATKPVQKTLWQIWYEPAAIPIYVTVGVACAGAGWYLARLMRGPDVIWNRHGNPEPWNNVEQGTNTKLWAVNQKFDKQYSRDRL